MVPTKTQPGLQVFPNSTNILYCICVWPDWFCLAGAVPGVDCSAIIPQESSSGGEVHTSHESCADVETVFKAQWTSQAGEPFKKSIMKHFSNSKVHDCYIIDPLDMQDVLQVYYWNICVLWRLLRPQGQALWEEVSRVHSVAGWVSTTAAQTDPWTLVQETLASTYRSQTGQRVSNNRDLWVRTVGELGILFGFCL